MTRDTAMGGSTTPVDGQLLKKNAVQPLPLSLELLCTHFHGLIIVEGDAPNAISWASIVR